MDIKTAIEKKKNLELGIKALLIGFLKETGLGIREVTIATDVMKGCSGKILNVDYQVEVHCEL